MKNLRTENGIIANWEGEIDKPLVSICCITYNHEFYIEDTLEGFLKQEIDFPFEILIHDDASTDNTADIIRKYVEKYPKLIKPIFQKENQYSKGCLISPRFLFPISKGKYIALCEGDDYWTDKGKLQKQVSFLEGNSDYAITYADCQPFDEMGAVDIDFGGARRDLESIELKKATPIFTLTTCFRNVIKDIPQDLMAARFGDLVMWSLLGQYGKGKYLPDIAPSAYRVHGGGVASLKEKKEKHQMRLITNASLLAYYMRLNNQELIRHFTAEVLRDSVQSLGLVDSMRTLVILGFRRLYIWFKKTCV